MTQTNDINIIVRFFLYFLVCVLRYKYVQGNETVANADVTGTIHPKY